MVKLGFQWNYDSQLSLTMACNGLFSGLLEFKQRSRHCGVPQKYAKNPNIGVWMRYQRSQHRLLRSGKKSFISDKKVAKL